MERPDPFETRPPRGGLKLTFESDKKEKPAEVEYIQHPISREAYEAQSPENQILKRYIEIDGGKVPIELMTGTRKNQAVKKKVIFLWESSLKMVP
ncbi:MAG TPA: hypothetical protein PK957_00830 [Candidatus Dojkabacteria bacterium]|nr:hypothetical protein [Candidatus Dojkabacteria bacterium]